MRAFPGITKRAGSFTVNARGGGTPIWIDLVHGDKGLVHVMLLEDLHDLRYAIDRTISEIEKYEAER